MIAFMDSEMRDIVRSTVTSRNSRSWLDKSCMLLSFTVNTYVPPNIRSCLDVY